MEPEEPYLADREEGLLWLFSVSQVGSSFGMGQELPSAPNVYELISLPVNSMEMLHA